MADRLDITAGERLEVVKDTPRCETRPAGRTKEWFSALAALQGTRHVDKHGRPRPLAFAALAHAHRGTFRLALRPHAAGRLTIGTLAVVAHVTGRAPDTTRDLGAVSGPAAGVAFIGGVAAGAAIASTPYPRPGAPWP
jgi:hypothetical protein